MQLLNIGCACVCGHAKMEVWAWAMIPGMIQWGQWTLCVYVCGAVLQG